jgi:hypothetical protein
MAKDFPDGARIEPHGHPRARLTWAVSRVMTHELRNKGRSEPFRYGRCREVSEMIKGWLTSMGLAALVGASVLPGAVAAPLAPAHFAVIATDGRVIEPVYYYNGRHYSYRYNNRYYAHRAYRHGHWHYY